MKLNSILKQAFSFFIISGIGWLIDFTTYFILTSLLGFDVSYANILSSIPAITYVFITSNKKIFNNNYSRFNSKQKYLIYFAYQVVLVSCVSLLGQVIYNLYMSSNYIDIALIFSNIKIIIKILITPLTMTLNFIVMKNLIEKL